MADLTDEKGGELKPWLVVSPSARFKTLRSAFAVRVTTTSKNSHLSTVIRLPGSYVHIFREHDWMPSK